MKYAIFIFLYVLVAEAAQAQMERFTPFAQNDVELWRITNNPNLRHWINYHNIQAWSPDGRYISIEQSMPHSYGSGAVWSSDPYTTDVYIFDLADEELIHLGRGQGPRWAKRHNWLFYIEYVSQAPNSEAKVIRYDIESQTKTVIATGFIRLDETDSQDDWIYGRAAAGDLTTEGNIFRIPVPGDGDPENVNGEIPDGRIIIPNPVHPVVFYRDDGSAPFDGTRYFSDPDGGNVRMAYPMLQRSHITWSGDGEYLLQGHRLVFGRRWDEPFPSNLHILSIASSGDPRGCGHDGRWVNTSLNAGSMAISDLRSGDYRSYLNTAGSYIHNSTSIDYSLGSYLMDNDAKCSPDGTKVVFVTNYDLKNGPRTKISGYTPGGNILYVGSTDGFPEQGRLSIGNEVVGYNEKTATSFIGITRNLYNTTSESLSGLTPEMIEDFRGRTSNKSFLKKHPVTKEKVEKLKIVTGEIPGSLKGAVTSYDMRSIPEGQRGTPPARFTDADFPEPDSALIWQNQTDAYVAVVRKPDPPYLRINLGRLELIPGEHHQESRGYYLLQNGERLTANLLQPGSTISIPETGNVSAVAVEWSGLESEPSHAVLIQNVMELDVLADTPGDFSWTQDRWLLNGQEVSAAEAQRAAASIREIVHLYDGVIHRETYQSDQLLTRDDLAENGETIRRQFYLQNRLVRREYHGHGRGLRTTERFDEQGYIVEVIQHATDGSEFSRTVFNNGMPMEHRGGSFMSYGSGRYKKEGDAWVRTTKK